MGLDMYAYTVSANMLEDTDQIVLNEKLKKIKELSPSSVNMDFFYWRKFNHLHGWMERLYRKKGGKQESFNCTPVRLMPEDIDQLEQDAIAGHLLHTPGFFFGDETLYPEDLQSLREFIAKSREAFKDGKAILYDSWW